MVHSTFEDTLASVSLDQDPAACLRALRLIKNSVIGNPTKKGLYTGLGVVPRLIELLSAPETSVDIKIEASVILGSIYIAGETEPVSAVDSTAAKSLLGCIASPNLRLVESSTRALKSIFFHQDAPRAEVFQSTFLADLVRLLVPSDNHLRTGPPVPTTSAFTQKGAVKVPVKITEIAATILSKLPSTHQEQLAILNAGAIPRFVDLLEPKWASYAKVQEAALEALANLSHGNKGIADAILSCKSSEGSASLDLIFALLSMKRSSLRLLAAKCLTSIAGVVELPYRQKSEMPLMVLPTVISLFSDTSPVPTHGPTCTVQEQAPLVFASLVGESEEYQRVAMENEAVLKLAGLIHTAFAAGFDKDLNRSPLAAASPSPLLGPNAKPKPGTKDEPVIPKMEISAAHSEKLVESTLVAIAAVCSLREECRKQVIDAKLLPGIIACLNHRSSPIRAAACSCVRSLSRSVKNLRTCLMDAGISQALIPLLDDASAQVQNTALATLCNIVLDFSPMKKTLVESGGVQRLVSLVCSTDLSLRLNSVWSLKNLIFHADSALKDSVMSKMGWATLRTLMDDPAPGIQEQALSFLRNLVCGGETDVNRVFVGLGEHELIRYLEQRLTNPNESIDVMVQALFVVVNILTGREQHQNSIVNSEAIRGSILRHLEHPSPQIRLAAAWCVINSTWPEDPGAQERIKLLRRYGYEERLTKLVDDSDAEVKDRIKTALANFVGVETRNTLGPNAGSIVGDNPEAASNRMIVDEPSTLSDNMNHFTFGSFGGNRP
ncbi:armadillo-type protein [Polychytrium aggregatum]|uniref:armadillo-type protein n=1 Tax=Polychytrium aggregatum TaxID=110093 RepID=UPI0022FF0969|nr:armadillo-type protein [Polychytrium aggregatum]KAI9204522.1 armadillo-type protein [Polychytrium aggregatum]